MDIQGFKKFAEQRKLKEETIKASIQHLQDFAAFLQKNGKDIDNASHQDFYDYSAHLISIGQNTFDNYLSILRYGFFKRINELYIAAMEVIDGSEVIENLSRRLVEEFGEDFRNEIFAGIEMPPLGIHPKEKPKYTKQLITRLEQKFDSERCIKFLGQGLRDRYEASRKPDREKFLKSKNIDEFLANKHREFVAELEKHYTEQRPFFTQEITKEVIELIKNDPYIESGVRAGDKIIVKKIPHMAKEYLKATDESKKRYYYCHCPWVKHAFLESDKPISPVFCNCSAGFYKAYWEIVLDQPVQVNVLKSLLKGDLICQFGVNLPED
ncbi:MAG: phage integrase N-terminal SAM-like domain-containing protein [candidate division WOR-3 bacterium]|nr:phage integrase N-terminal SAM-like domain-containing protein [candidate division WOR-3 bacterium]